MRAFFAFIAAVIPALAPTLAYAAECPAARILSLNSHAHLAPRGYPEPNARGRADYSAILGFDESGLRAGDVVVDSGGGFGAAALEWTRELGVKAYVINAQDNYAALASTLQNLRSGQAGALAFNVGTGKILSIDGLSPEIFDSLAAALGIESPSPLAGMFAGEEQARGAALSLGTKVIAAVQRSMKDESFNYRVGYSETELPKIGERAKRIADLWGAFSYSAARVELLAMYYRALAADGIAYVLVSNRLKNYVVVNRTNRMKFSYRTAVSTGDMGVSLIQYLVQKYPTVFSVGDSQHPGFKKSLVLVMKRDPSIELLDPPLTALSFDRGSGATPIAIYKER